MKRYFFLFFTLLIASFLSAQTETHSVNTAKTDTIANQTAVVFDPVAAVKETPVKVLTADEKACKDAAEKVMKIYESWSVDRDYEILKPRIESYVNDFFAGGENEAKMKEYYTKTKVLLEQLGSVKNEILNASIAKEVERIDQVLASNPKGIALPGSITNAKNLLIEFFIIDLNKYAKEENDSKLLGVIKKLTYEYRRINRLSILYHNLTTKVSEESRRVIAKNTYFLYISDGMANGLKSIAQNLGNVIRNKKDVLLEEQAKKVKFAYNEKQNLIMQNEKLKTNNASDDEIKKNEQAVRRAHNNWLNERTVSLDKLYAQKVSKLIASMSLFLKKPGTSNLEDELVLKIKNNDSDFENYFKTNLKYKFYTDLIAKLNFYFTYNVDTGFRPYRANVLIISIMFMILFFYVLYTVKKKKDTLFIRKIAGLEAIDDAVGRATEMGKPVLYNSGLGQVTNIQTIASMLILNKVAKKVAEFKAEIIYPAYDPIVLQVAEEMIASGFLDAGCPEDHKKENCFFLVQDQFAYAAGLSGLIARAKPATCFHFGSYAAESLLISEAGYAAGAIQVAGTVDASQLPFFIAACDYTLIGEELYAAAAYMSREPQILSNLKLSDYGKLVLGLLFLIGTIILTINSEWTFLPDLFSTH